ncbi:MAG TPA: inorganic phosphate transporter [Fimbriimonadaceae bacterium]|nr:inorganic phosphate transporter [Fimbriimonadaceae bacterium]
MDVLLVLVVLFALLFDYINGFHDTANAIATVVSTRVLTPLAAILMAAILNFAGALVATNVAKTIAGGIIAKQPTSGNVPLYATETVVLAAIIGGIIWNLITWRFGIPSSSSHALIGGLVGAALARGFAIAQTLPHGAMGVVDWKGILDKVILPLIASPLVGLIVGFLIMAGITMAFAHWHPKGVGAVFKRLQLLSSALMAFAHGQNDAQKSMGVITLALMGHGVHVALTKKGDPEIPLWVIISCASVMALGTSAGGWRIIRTMGHRIIRLEPVNGFAAESAGAAVILTASHFAMPVSTTHCIAGSIFGVGAAKRLSAVRWQVAINMVVAWIVTIPAAATFGGLAYWAISAMGG